MTSNHLPKLPVVRNHRGPLGHLAPSTLLLRLLLGSLMSLLTPRPLVSSERTLSSMSHSSVLHLASMWPGREDADRPQPSLGLQFFLSLHVVLPLKARWPPGLHPSGSRSGCCAQWPEPVLPPVLKERVSPRLFFPAIRRACLCMSLLGSWALDVRKCGQQGYSESESRSVLDFP